MSICLRCRKAQRPKRHTWWSHSNTLLSAQCVHKGMAPSPFAACHDCAAVTFAHTCLVYQSLVLHNAYILLSATHPPPSHTHTHTHTHTYILPSVSLSFQQYCFLSLSHALMDIDIESNRQRSCHVGGKMVYVTVPQFFTANAFPSSDTLSLFWGHMAWSQCDFQLHQSLSILVFQREDVFLPPGVSRCVLVHGRREIVGQQVYGGPEGSRNRHSAFYPATSVHPVCSLRCVCCHRCHLETAVGKTGPLLYHTLSNTIDIKDRPPAVPHSIQYNRY